MDYFIRCDASDRILQFDAKTKTWSIMVQGKRYLVGDENDDATLALLPFLEHSFDDLEKLVFAFLQQHPESSFPFEVFIHAGLKHGSPHWVGCSLRWLSQLKKSYPQFTEHLERIVYSNKRYSQKTRQMAAKLLSASRQSYQ